MTKPSQSPGIRSRVSGAYPCAFRGQDLEKLRAVVPRTFFWNMHTELEQYGVDATPQAIVKIAKVCGVPVTLKLGRELIQEMWDYIARDNAEDECMLLDHAEADLKKTEERVALLEKKVDDTLKQQQALSKHEFNQPLIAVAETIVYDARLEQGGIDWCAEPKTERERAVRRFMLDEHIERVKRGEPGLSLLAFSTLIGLEAYISCKQIAFDAADAKRIINEVCDAEMRTRDERRVRDAIKRTRD